MQITLMHNPKAGTESRPKVELVAEFERAGHKIVYCSTKDKGFLRALDDPGELVVIAGGDGTVRKIGRRLIGRNVPIAILPLGTANNIAKALGLESNPQQLIRALAKPRLAKFDVGIARGPWGDVPFLEAAGAGLFPRMMSDHHSNRKEGVPDAVDVHGGIQGGVRFLRQVLGQLRGCECVVRLDDRNLRGKYLLVEAMNIPSLGPALELAPNAHPSDGLLDLVLVKESQRRELGRRLEAHVSGRNGSPFVVHRTREVQLSCSANEFHFDDECWPDKPMKQAREAKPITKDISIEIGILPGALRVLIP